MRLYGLKQLAIATGLYEPIRSLRNSFNKESAANTEKGLRFYGQFIKSGDLVFDIGANVGGKTELFCKLGAQVVAIEPQPKMFKILEARTRKYGPRVTALRIGVGAEPDVAALHFGDHDGMASLSNDWSKNDNGSIQIELRTLDQLIESYGRPDFIKIDIEGHELEALKGLSHLVRGMSFEYHHDPVRLRLASECVAHVSQKQKMRMNLTGMEDYDLISSWMPADEFSTQLEILTKDHPFGDIIAVAE